MRSGNHGGQFWIGFPSRLACKALIDNILCLGKSSCAQQARIRTASGSQQRLSQPLIVGGGNSKPIASDDADLGDREQEMNAFIPAQPRTPADIGLSCQPSLRRLALRVVTPVLSNTS